MKCVEKTKLVAKAMADKDWDLVVELKGRSFMRNLETYRQLHQRERKIKPQNNEKSNFNNIAIINIGAPACGMNSAVQTFVRAGLFKNHMVYGIHDGINGLLNGQLKEMKWPDVRGWIGKEGSLLGQRERYLDEN